MFTYNFGRNNDSLKILYKKLCIPVKKSLKWNFNYITFNDIKNLCVSLL